MIDVRNLTRTFGDVTALDAVSFTVDRGAIFGLIGPNGAGKTTCLNILATLLKPDSGTVTVDGLDILDRIRDIRRRIGYMPDFFGTYRKLTTWEYLDFFGGASGVPNQRRQRRLDEVLELTHLVDKRDEQVDNLSRGMKQRLCLAKTLIHEPPLLLLDEPASGLDPRARHEIRNILRDIAGPGCTVLISSHILSELEPLCTHIGILERGKLLRTGRLQDVLSAVRPTPAWRLEVGSDPESARARLAEHPAVAAVEIVNGALIVTLADGRPSGALPLDLLQALEASGVTLLACTPARPKLEDAFLALTEGLLA